MNQPTSGTRDGFQLTRDYFTVLPGSSALDHKSKRAIAICHLFLNRKMAVADIVWLLDEENGTVVRALLEQGVIQEPGRSKCATCCISQWCAGAPSTSSWVHLPVVPAVALYG